MYSLQRKSSKPTAAQSATTSLDPTAANADEIVLTFPLTGGGGSWRTLLLRQSASGKWGPHPRLGVMIFVVLAQIPQMLHAFSTMSSAGSKLTFFLVILAMFSLGLFLRTRPCLTLSGSGVRKWYVTQFKWSKKKIQDRPYSKKKWSLQVNRTWSDLRSVRYQEAKRLPAMSANGWMDQADSIVFDWDLGNSAHFGAYHALQSADYINLALLSPQQRQQFFLILSRSVPQEILSPEVLFLQVQALSGSDDVQLNDYTQIWLEEYNRRFEISNYVTLIPGAVCGNGRFTIAMTIATRINTSTYLASDKAGRKVVIKELIGAIDSDDATQKKQLEQFQREATLLSRLNHLSIVKIRDHFIENNRAYIVMDCVPGRNLREHVRLNGILNQSEAVAIALQLASALEYLHGNTPPILHRDFTPDNMVYVDRTKSVIVIDFGAANIFTGGKTATLVGKQFFMPPEQFRGQPSPASDVYAFGATLCFLMTGKELPSMGKTPTFDTNLVSPEMIALIESCTQFDSTKRPDCESIQSSLELLSSPPALAANLQ